jgi:hypothetical protein
MVSNPTMRKLEGLAGFIMGLLLGYLLYTFILFDLLVKLICSK